MTIMDRRGLIALAGGALAAPRLVSAADWPTRPVRIIVPYPPGGVSDITARLLAEHLTPVWGQAVTVENRPGANGMIGAEAVARAAPDGTTLLVSTVSTYAMAPWLYQLPYDNDRDLVGLGLLAAMPIIMVVNKDFPARTLAEFVALARQPNHRITYANSGIGSSTHLATELFLQEARLTIADVGYRGGGPAVQGVIANETPMVFQAASGILPQIQGGTLRALGIASPQRSPLAPEIPTFAEQGFPGVVVEEHIALQAPAGLPPEIIRRANELARAAMNAADTRLRLATLAVLPMVTSPDDWPAYFAAENAKWRDMIRARNIRVQ